MTESKTTLIRSKRRKTRIIISCYPLIRESLKQYINKQQDMKVIAETGDGRETVDITTQLNPDIVVMDSDMPILNGLEAAKEITHKCPRTKILILNSSGGENKHLADMKKLSVYGCMPIDLPGEAIIHALRMMNKGKKTFTPTQILETPTEEEDNSDSRSLFKSFYISDKELQIITLVARGLNNKDIAIAINRSVPNVKANLNTIFLKLGVSSRTEMVYVCVKNGILTLDDFK